MPENKLNVAIVKITNSLKSVVPLLISVPAATPYCAVIWNDEMIVGCFDYFGADDDLEGYSTEVRIDAMARGFNYIGFFPEYSGMPAASYGGLVEQNVKTLMRVSPRENVLTYAQNCLSVARRRLRDALTSSDVEFAMADCDRITSSIATIKLGGAAA